MAYLGTLDLIPGLPVWYVFNITIIDFINLDPTRWRLESFSWRAIASQHFMLMSGFAGHIDSWLAIDRHEKIDQLEKSIGYNSCDAQRGSKTIR